MRCCIYRPLLYLFILPIIAWLVPAKGLCQNDKALPYQWRVPGVCGGEADVVSRVARILDGAFVAATNRRVHGEIRAVDARWVVGMRVFDDSQPYERTITVHTCHAALEVAALLTALAIDPMAVMHSDDPSLEARMAQLDNDTVNEPVTAPVQANDAPSKAVPTNGTGAVRSDPAPIAPVNNTPAPADADATEAGGVNWVLFRFAAGAGVQMDFGTLAAVRPGVTLTGAFFWRQWIGTVSVGYLPPMTQTVTTAQHSVHFTSQAFLPAVGAGRIIHLNRLLLGGSVAVAAIGIRAAATGIVRPVQRSVWTGKGSVCGHVAWRFSRSIGVWLTVSADALLARPRFYVEGVGTVYQPRRVVATALISLFFTRGNGN
ncbi:MAG: hypothetical protein JXR76_14260 [Deltaproteobacteria bacterium]|nr:hypothetical protein [Deltaproteobacteria bacterium]